MSWESDLEMDLEWRLAELAALKIHATTAPKGSILSSALLRALTAMLYAHYEGYCKTIIRLYLREIKSRGVRRGNCKEPLAVFSLQKSFREAKSLPANACLSFYRSTLNQVLQEVIEYELDRNGEIILAGESNLYPKDLKANLDCACLTQSEVDNNETLLKQLVGRRNGIAHGQKLVIADLAMYENFEKAAIAAMIDIACGIIEALKEESYLKPYSYRG